MTISSQETHASGAQLDARAEPQALYEQSPLPTDELMGNLALYIRGYYRDHLERLLSVHEANNVLGHIRDRHSLIAGDVTETAPAYFREHPETTVALAYFDMGLYEPTKAGLEAIRPNLVPGSVILLDEFSWPDAKGEAIAFREVCGREGYLIDHSTITPMRAIVTIR